MQKKKATECSSIDEIRENIDAIDREIIDLFASRFEFVKEIVKYKSPDPQSIIAQERYNKVLSDRAAWANEKGLNGDVISNMYKTLLDYFIGEEIKIINKTK